ncbi:MAG: hypothetical protein OXG81_15005 [Acidobacteria bacterium]|nr:hypothetical protein [Acidobacteriota bacterium]
MSDTRSGPKTGFFGPMKGLDSARHRVERRSGGRLRASIEHDTMKGVSPEMLRWWFENIDTWTRYNGRDFAGPLVPVYRYWHPFDHITVRWHRRVYVRERLGPGSVIEIHEDIGGKHPVRARARVSKFDDEAFNFDLLLGGLLRVGSLDHLYAEVEGGCSFYTEARVGVRVPIIGRLLNWIIRRQFTEELLRDWIVHNVEESGETEKFVPALFEEALLRASRAGDDEGHRDRRPSSRAAKRAPAALAVIGRGRS